MGDVRVMIMYENRNETCFEELSQFHDLSNTSEYDRAANLDGYRVITEKEKKYFVAEYELEDDEEYDFSNSPKVPLTRFICNDNRQFDNNVFLETIKTRIKDVAVPFIEKYLLSKYSEPFLIIGTKSFWNSFEALKDDFINIHRHMLDKNNHYDFQIICEDLYKKIQLQLSGENLCLDTSFIFAKLPQDEPEVE